MASRLTVRGRLAHLELSDRGIRGVPQIISTPISSRQDSALQVPESVARSVLKAEVMVVFRTDLIATVAGVVIVVIILTIRVILFRLLAYAALISIRIEWAAETLSVCRVVQRMVVFVAAFAVTVFRIHQQRFAFVAALAALSMRLVEPK